MSKEKINLNISGMTCVNCSNGIEKVVGKLKGLESSKVSFASNEGEFYINTEFLDKQSLINKIEKLGYGVEENLEALEKSKLKAYNKLKRVFILSATIAVIMFYFMFFPLENMQINQYLMFFLATVVQFYAGSRFYILAFKALRNKNYDMNVLVALGTSAAYFYSVFVVLFPSLFPEHLRFIYFDGAVVIITFILLGRLLEERSKAKATDFLKKLMDLAPLNATLICEDGSYKTILATQLKVGDRVLIKSGEKISTDALIKKGSADIDTSMITGESMPVYKTIGDEVIAGTLNTSGVIEVEVLKESKDTTLSKIVELLSTAQSKKLPISRFADKVANIFVPAVILASVVTFLVWFFIVGDTMGAILASISVLIISCPCALGLATPIAIVSAVGKGAHEGILIKNPEILELIKDIKYAVFDKTGTLTTGIISVKDALYEESLLDILASLETQSEHPISKAVVNFAKAKNLACDKTFEDTQIIAGQGISASFEDKKLLIGSLSFLEKNDVVLETKYLEFYNKSLNDGSGVILASFDKKCVAVFALADTIKQGAKELIINLKAKNITPILLTGDNETTANSVAEKLGIEKVYAQVLPDEKYKVIIELQKEAKVMFVGDGINDSPSIKQADIGITLNSGSDITKDAGDIILINNDLNAVLKSINLSIESMKIIKQNLFWAFIYNAAGIPLAAGVFFPIFGIMLSPMYAGIAMSFSSVTVVLNSLRLKLKKI
ncbi:heavy metal translocating P-type ATPase [Arcobacter venerupis]|uniref:Copper-transporting ATPase n=1 Tax=Arcobacter venerupis TaxID=1054033 RepID=A0AAE7B937_9BACT|nr:heavy metal translocating P-type ATPase [Arcobacter venerupis]QKF66019.1 heavy metal translocating P-type ATPase [Arcobacter venerupis]RWS49375.1 copper-translocating P-type ATPase [Arcobacter venerupis]